MEPAGLRVPCSHRRALSRTGSGLPEVSADPQPQHGQTEDQVAVGDGEGLLGRVGAGLGPECVPESRRRSGERGQRGLQVSSQGNPRALTVVGGPDAASGCRGGRAPVAVKCRFWGGR